MTPVALVTGGAGALGAAITNTFHHAGYHVHATSSGRGATSSELAEVHPVDLADLAAVRELARRFEQVNALVLAAGGFAAGALCDFGPSDLEEMLRINVKTAAHALAAFAPKLVAGAGVVLVGSQAYEGAAGMAAYAASKAAVVSLSKSAAAELGGRGVRVNVVLPDIIDTQANRAAMPQADTSRWSPPDAIAKVVLWLCSSDAALVSGNAIRLGRSAQ